MLKSSGQLDGNGSSRIEMHGGRSGATSQVVQDNSWARSVVRVTKSSTSEGQGCGRSDEWSTMRSLWSNYG
jgi:uncharacterized protein YgfB (UPF0149 family)